MNKLFTLILLCLAQSLLAYHVQGVIRDENGEALSYATVVAEGTNLGATANEQGHYHLDLNRGEYKLVFQYLGYEKEIRQITIDDKNITIDVQLKPSVYSLSEISVSSNQEDPAYRVIRAAIAHRKENGHVDFPYSAEAYTKGFMKILDSPKKILGQKVGNMEGILDSNRQGILYLSETYSKIDFDPPKTIIETILSSKVSGDNNGFSFNQANALNFNLYENTIPFGADIISPIADYALQYYKYSLIGLSREKDGTGIYRINCMPKNNIESVWTGELFIQEGTWTIHAFNGYLVGKQIKQPLFDTIRISQQHTAWLNHSLHQVQNQIFEFKAGLLGIKLYGKFLLDYSKFDKKEFEALKNKRELLIIEKGANLKSTQYWDSIRPVPLTVEELADYKNKDSMIIVKNSKSYKDSLDNISNAFEWSDLLFGYTYQNSYKKRYFNFISPLQLIQFHPVTGLAVHANFRYSKYLDEQTWFRHIITELNSDYGLSEKKFRLNTGISYFFDPFKNKSIRLRLGTQITPYTPVNEMLNQLSCLFWKNNQLKLYERKFIDLSFATDINYDWRIKVLSGIGQRKNLENHSDYSIRFPNAEYESNDKAQQTDDEIIIRNKNVFYSGLNLIWQPGTVVSRTPLEIQKLGSDYPEFSFLYQIKTYDGTHYLHDLQWSAKQSLALHRWGELQYKCTAFQLYGKDRDVPEKVYASGQAFPLYIRQDDMSSFLEARPFELEIKDFGVQTQILYNMKGLILDQLPLIKRLGLNQNIRVSMLNRPDHPGYLEFGLGLSNLGFKAFRLLNLDWVNVLEGSNYRGSSLRLGISSSLRVGG